jgi:hypothetical protein
MGAPAEERARDSWAASLIVLGFALAPLLLDWGYKVLVKPLPYWVHYYDPETIYFYGGLRLLDGHTPHNVDNPGMPLHLLSALVLWIVGAGPLDYERFLALAHVVALLLTVLAALGLLRTLLAGLPRTLQLAALWTYFLCPQALEYNSVWSPETLYFPLGSLVLLAAWKYFAGPLSYRAAGLFGAALGVGVALKFTFLAWVPALVVSVLSVRCPESRPRIKLAAVALLGVGLSFLLTTMVIISRYPSQAVWLWNLLSRSGDYGHGQQELPTISDFLHHLATAVWTSKGWTVWVVGSLAFAFAFRRRSSRLPAGLRGVAVFALAAMLFSYLGAARHLQLRYLLPTGLAVLLLFVLGIRGLVRPFPDWARVGVLIVASLLLAKTIVDDLSTHRARVTQGECVHEQIANTVQQLTKEGQSPIIVYGWRVPEPSFALRIYALDREFLDALASRFPTDGHYNPWLRQVHLPKGARTWDYLIVSPEDLPAFPEPRGPVVATVGEYHVVAAPSRDP